MTRENVKLIRDCFKAPVSKVKNFPKEAFTERRSLVGEEVNFMPETQS